MKRMFFVITLSLSPLFLLCLHRKKKRRNVKEPSPVGRNQVLMSKSQALLGKTKSWCFRASECAMTQVSQIPRREDPGTKNWKYKVYISRTVSSRRSFLAKWNCITFPLAKVMHTFLLTRSQPREGFYLLPRGGSRPPAGNLSPLLAKSGKWDPDRTQGSSWTSELLQLLLWVRYWQSHITKSTDFISWDLGFGIWDFWKLYLCPEALL